MNVRRDKGLSQEELAHICGSSQAWINKIELGKSKISIEFLYKISSALDCDIFNLIPKNIGL